MNSQSGTNCKTALPTVLCIYLLTVVLLYGTIYFMLSNAQSDIVLITLTIQFFNELFISLHICVMP